MLNRCTAITADRRRATIMLEEIGPAS